MIVFFICFRTTTNVIILHHIAVLPLSLFLLESASDIMPQKAVVTQDSSTPDVQSKHITLPMPDT